MANSSRKNITEYGSPLVDQCIFPYNLTRHSNYRGCFWNPAKTVFQCVTRGNSRQNCHDSCPRECKKHFWKCKDECISISDQCEGECMPEDTFPCGNHCHLMDTPWKEICGYNHTLSGQTSIQHVGQIKHSFKLFLFVRLFIFLI